jgi:aldehyde dehydrogenase (NAD+)
MTTDVHSNFIAGEWRQSSSAKINENPSDLDAPVGMYAQGTAQDVEDAVAAARHAAPAWAATTPTQRAAVLSAVASELSARSEELGKLLSSEEGKTLPEGIGEVKRAADIFTFFAGEVYRASGELVPSARPGIEVEIRRHPVGVVGIITPWNFPMAIPAWKIAPALAYGNAVVFKPADLVPACAWALTDMLSRAGLPAGTFNLVMGSGSVVGEAIVSSPGVDAITFTGSDRVGRHVATTAVARLAKVQLEMGGKNPIIVLDDADLGLAVDNVVNGAYFSTGQRCTASSRVIVTNGIHDRFVEALAAKTRALRVGHALAADTQIGPVVDASQLGKDLDYVKIGQDEGATALVQGGRVERDTRGHFLAPTLFVDTTPDMRINREEMFGPIATIQRATDYEEALALANDTEFGLAGSIMTSSLKYADHYKKHAQVGMAMVNLPTAGVDFHVPFGGTKGSSYGPREQGPYAKEFFTTVRTTYVRAG